MGTITRGCNYSFTDVHVPVAGWGLQLVLVRLVVMVKTDTSWLVLGVSMVFFQEDLRYS